MRNSQTLEVVKKFDALPAAAEKDEISRKYLENEISTFEFFCLANAYLSKEVDK